MKTLGAALACLTLASAGVAGAQTYPARPITFVVSAAAGGISDVAARSIGQRLSERLGQQVVVENRGGGAHVAGAIQVAKAAPDGHTVLIAEAGTFVINPLMGKDTLSYNVETDFAPITGLIRVNQAIVVRKDFPATTIADLVAAARQKPGQVTYATSGVGSAPHVNIALMQQMAGVTMQPIHYRGAAPALNDILAGHVDVMSISVSSVVQPWRQGGLKILAVGSSHRIDAYPEIPTVAESGIPGYEGGAWIGMMTTAKTPPEIVGKLNAEVTGILRDPDFKARFLDPQLFEPMASSPDAFARYIRNETDKWAKVIRDQNIAVAQ